MVVLTQKERDEIKSALDTSVRPFIYFHDDPDGLASYLLFMRYKKEGKGHAVKAVPHITEAFVQRVKDYDADHVFILDIALVDQEFIDGVSVPVTWIDHHGVQDMQRVHYYNPRKSIGQNIPTPYMCYEVVQQDLWLEIPVLFRP